jgi:hypothetical protein
MSSFNQIKSRLERMSHFDPEAKSLQGSPGLETDHLFVIYKKNRLYANSNDRTGL